MRFIIIGIDSAKVELSEDEAQLFTVFRHLMEDTIHEPTFGSGKLEIEVLYAGQGTLDAIKKFSEFHCVHNRESYIKYRSLEERNKDMNDHTPNMTIWENETFEQFGKDWASELTDSELKEIRTIVNYLDNPPMSDTVKVMLVRKIKLLVGKIMKIAGRRDITHCMRDLHNPSMTEFHAVRAEICKFLDANNEINDKVPSDI